MSAGSPPAGAFAFHAVDLRFRGRPDICVIIPQRGHLLVLDEAADHHGVVSPAAHRSAGEVPMTADLLPDLERFWPSRRGHTFDEFCRS